MKQNWPYLVINYGSEPADGDQAGGGVEVMDADSHRIVNGF